jgi:hypothetical protein
VAYSLECLGKEEIRKDGVRDSKYHNASNWTDGGEHSELNQPRALIRMLARRPGRQLMQSKIARKTGCSRKNASDEQQWTIPGRLAFRRVDHLCDSPRDDRSPDNYSERVAECRPAGPINLNNVPRLKFKLIGC